MLQNVPQGDETKKDLVRFAQRLGIVYSGKPHIEEFRYPGLAIKAQKLFQSDPRKYGSICARLLDGDSVHSIAQTLHTPDSLIRFIRSMHPELVAAGRQNMISALEETVICLATRLMNEAGTIQIEKVPAALSATLDKLSLLTGGVTQRVEHTSAPKPEDLRKLFESLPRV